MEAIFLCSECANAYVGGEGEQCFSCRTYKVPIIPHTHASKEPDPVNSPSHYNFAGIECIDAIKAALGPEGFRDYMMGNVLKYSWRYKYKNGIEDLKKASWYLSRTIKEMEDDNSQDT